MTKKYLITEIVDCSACNGTGKDGKISCLKCFGTGKTHSKVSFEDALKEFMVDVPNTGYFGIIIPKRLSDDGDGKR